jgi:hypothetical protein
MHDFNFSSDFGRWFDFKIEQNNNDEPILKMHLDTITYDDADVTGWRLRFGHLFLGFNDLSVRTSLDKSVAVEFDFRIPIANVRRDGGKYSGFRVAVGALLDWREALPRNNKSHFLEVNLAESPGYGDSYGEPRLPLCRDRQYDRCFYSDDGRWAEGRFLSYAEINRRAGLGSKPVSDWRHVLIPISEIAKQMGWASRPESWSGAYLTGLYIGIESQGETTSTVEIKNYDVYLTP